jgi:energy-converting hydrogenase Eha subunit A
MTLTGFWRPAFVLKDEPTESSWRSFFATQPTPSLAVGVSSIPIFLGQRGVVVDVISQLRDLRIRVG